ncbi:ribosome small subunit-dependent GTPase A [Plantactinospora sp. GCM10030261]|uniref:ribosome small subunit-dependent GTPase A n=1 Tax=Plantactinospora sp. GCM10030261 TaxID=3273420 RepID=UPI00361D6F77
MTIDLWALGWSPALAERAGRCPDLHPGRVTRADRGVLTVLGVDGPVRASLGGAVLAAAAKDPADLPCAGDWVLVRRWPDDRITAEAVLPRHTVVIRRTAGKDSTGQVLAANLDTAAVIEPVHPEPDIDRIERLLALAWESGAEPLVVLTKCDLAADPAALADQLAEVAPGVPVLPVTAHRPGGLAALRPYAAPGRTLGLLGPSGAGKSSLVNGLVGSTAMVTQAIRRVDGKGRHTTTHRALVPIPGGGAVLDTPGIRAVGLQAATDGLARAFADVTELIGACRFADCAHRVEPGCAVRGALESGNLAPRRWESWQRLNREVAVETGRRDARLADKRQDVEWRRRRRHDQRPGRHHHPPFAG